MVIEDPRTMIATIATLAARPAVVLLVIRVHGIQPQGIAIQE
jgi:hypothetical protein